MYQESEKWFEENHEDVGPVASRNGRNVMNAYAVTANKIETQYKELWRG